MRELRDSVLRAVALVVTDRRWAAPLSAMALGFGLFLGVAIGPNATGTMATGSAPILALAPGGGDDGESEASRPRAEEEPFAAAPEAEAFEEPEYAEPEYAPETEAPAPAPEPAPEPAPPAPEPDPAEESEAVQLVGTVVHANPAAGSYTLALAGGEPAAVHAAELPEPGDKLSVEAEPLPNNTFGELEREEEGTAATAELRGVVTHVDPDPDEPAYVLSGRGASIPVSQPGPGSPPALGSYATVRVAIEPVGATASSDLAASQTDPADPLDADPSEQPEADPTEPPPVTDPPDPTPPLVPAPEPPAPTAPPVPVCAPDPDLKPPPEPTHALVERELETEPEPAVYVDLAAVLVAACPSTGQLLLSADDTRRLGADLTVTLPKRFKTAKLEPGDSILATANLAEDGTLTLAGIASDERRKGAADQSLAQGDLKR